MGLAAFALGRVVTKQAMAVAPAQMATEPGMYDEPMTAGGEPVVDGRSHPEPIARYRPITGGSDQQPATSEQEAATTESEQVPAHQ